VSWASGILRFPKPQDRSFSPLCTLRSKDVPNKSFALWNCKSTVINSSGSQILGKSELLEEVLKIHIPGLHPGTSEWFSGSGAAIRADVWDWTEPELASIGSKGQRVSENQDILSNVFPGCWFVDHTLWSYLMAQSRKLLLIWAVS
jgi:hypothetical protein